VVVACTVGRVTGTVVAGAAVVVGTAVVVEAADDVGAAATDAGPVTPAPGDAEVPPPHDAITTPASVNTAVRRVVER
jgi:hypothetical protein